MGLDQQASIIAARKDLEEVYTFNYGNPNNTTIFDNANEPQELYLHNQYTVQGFMMELAKSKGFKDENKLNGAYIRVKEKDVKKLYKISKDIDLMKKYSNKWRKDAGKFCDDYDQEQVRNFCLDLMKYVAFDDEYVAYFESDW